MFHPVVQTWLERQFGAPTPAQAAGLAADRRRAGRAGHRADRLGQDAGGVPLGARPAGRRGDRGGRRPRRPDQRPLRLAAQGAVERRPAQPRGAARRAARRWPPSSGYPAPEIRTAVRTGDTTARERREATRRPPHVLVTTPESLFILLTSESGRRALRDVRTVIVDEIHAVAADKRGAHLALSLERLDALVAAPAARACSASACRRRCGRSRSRRGCSSARTRPLARARRRRPAARSRPRRRGARGRARRGRAPTSSGASSTTAIAALARAHQSTLVFVNTRRLVERVTLPPRRAPGRRRGRRPPRQPVARAAPPRRAAAQGGRAQAWSSRPPRSSSASTSAPSSSRCLIGSPRSIATGLQRIGRSGHALGATPKGRLFPLTRDQLVECAALVRAARRAEIDAVAPAGRAARRPRAADRRRLPPARSGTRTRSTTSAARAGALRRARARRLRRRRRHALRGHRHQPRARGRAAPPRRASTAGCAGGAARAWPRSPRAAPSPTTPTTTSSSSPTGR